MKWKMNKERKKQRETEDTMVDKFVTVFDVKYLVKSPFLINFGFAR